VALRRFAVAAFANRRRQAKAAVAGFGGLLDITGASSRTTRRGLSSHVVRYVDHGLLGDVRTLRKEAAVVGREEIAKLPFRGLPPK
jgi:hypothetical protein